MIHGMWGGPWCWENYTRFFGHRGYRCVTPTLRFHEQRPQDLPDARLGTTSLQDYVQDLEREITKLDRTPVIMGHSMGGLLAQILASRGLARGLVLLTSAAPSGIIAIRPTVIRSFWSALTRWGFWRKPFRQTYEEAVYSMMHLLSVGDRERAYRRFVYESGRAASEIGFWFLDSKRAARVDAATVRCPILVVGAAEDRITPVSVARRIARKYGAVATYKEFANHAHWLLAEPDWEQSAAYVADWMDKALVSSAA